MRIGRVATADGIRYCRPEGEGVRLLAGAFGSGLRPDDQLLPAGAFRLSSPVQPAKVLVVLGAFPRDGDREAARATPPRFAAKLPSALTAAGDDVIVPAEIGDAVTIEPELAVVIGAPLRRATPAEAADAVLGYTCMNDVTHLPYIREHGDFLRAKSVDTFGPLGPWIETGITEEDISAGLTIRAFVDGRLVHAGDTRDFTHCIGEVVSEASRFYTLEPGDVISLGTPLDPVTARVGNTVVVEVERVGALENRLVAEREAP
ncbi:MAG: fumarylacetoacetate hydrolase family protein [Actinomycetota bacterium]|nr:fumarylacetoacetate hydrolase family protein [Actinomycetota bacterium]